MAFLTKLVNDQLDPERTEKIQKAFFNRDDAKFKIQDKDKAHKKITKSIMYEEIERIWQNKINLFCEWRAQQVQWDKEIEYFDMGNNWFSKYVRNQLTGKKAEYLRKAAYYMKYKDDPELDLIDENWGEIRKADVMDITEQWIRPWVQYVDEYQDAKITGKIKKISYTDMS